MFIMITLLMLFSGCFGILGMACNLYLPEIIGDVDQAVKVGISIVFSGLVSLVVSRMTARVVGRWLPSVRSHGLDSTDLNGCYAKVIGEKLNAQELGRISVTSKESQTFNLRAKLMDGHDEVGHGDLVVVHTHDQASDICFCVPESAWTPRRK